MKVIGRLQAVAGFREKVEEYTPVKGVIIQNLIDMVKDTYQFQIFPSAAPGSPVLTNLAFINGRFGDGDDLFGINNLMMEPNGDIVIATTTDQAELVLHDLTRRLDEGFGYRLKDAKKKPFFVSNIVVEFDSAFEQKIDQLTKMVDLIRSINPTLQGIGLRQLAFGRVQMAPFSDQISQLEATDFTIEQRVGSEPEEHRYFSTAPMRTDDHIRTLEAIEAIALGKVN